MTAKKKNYKKETQMNLELSFKPLISRSPIKTV